MPGMRVLGFDAAEGQPSLIPIEEGSAKGLDCEDAEEGWKQKEVPQSSRCCRCCRCLLGVLLVGTVLAAVLVYIYYSGFIGATLLATVAPPQRLPDRAAERVVREHNISSATRLMVGGDSILRIKVALGRDSQYWDWTPLRVIDAGTGNVSLATSHGTYVSAHLDGTLGATSPSVGPDEVFQEIAGANGTYALKSTFNTFLRAETDGLMSLNSTQYGSAENFTKLDAGVSGEMVLKSESEGRVIAAVGYKMSLLTSAFIPAWGDNPHTHEIYTSLLVNLLNDAFYDVHVLTESNCTALLEQLEWWAAKMPNVTSVRLAMRKKLVCAQCPTLRQPTYKDFFEYANNALDGGLVLFANGDIVFDETLRRLQPDELLKGKFALILSVLPPPQNGYYKQIHGFECTNSPRCAVGSWQGGAGGSAGVSWDAYIFASPLPPTFKPWEGDVIMNIYGAEQVAAHLFEEIGLTLYDPCYHVHAFHWHCQGGKMHSLNHAVKVDGGPHRAVKGIYPCWHCPGVTMPRGSAKQTDLCRSGTRMNVWQVPALKAHFHQPAIAVNVCCSNPGTCKWMNVQWLGACVGPDDVDCVIWEFVGGKIWY